MSEQEKEWVKMIQMGNNICITLHKKALMALKDGSSIPLHMTSGKTTIKIVLMRDTTFQISMQRFQVQEKLKQPKPEEKKE